MIGPRDVVTQRVSRRARQFPEVELVALDRSGLRERDAALASAIDHAVARRWLTLVALIRPALSRPWRELQSPVKAALLVGAGQLFLLDRVPDHAAIHEAVSWTKRAVGTGASKLVNAVLRRLARLKIEVVPVCDRDRRDELPLADGRAWRLAEAVFDEDPIRRAAAKTSHPEPLLARWVSIYGRERALALAEHDLVHAPIIVAGSSPDVPGFSPHETAGFHVLTGRREDLERALDRDPALRVQDPALAAPVECTRGIRASVILDACAGKGTKTRQLAGVHPAARIVAAEIDPSRRSALARVTADDDRVTVVEAAGDTVPTGSVDLLVLDVPCSNTGVLARRVEAKYRSRGSTLASLVDLQRRIVAETVPLLADGGHLLYATCSVEPAENEAQAEWIAREYGLTVVTTEAVLPCGGPGEPPGLYHDGGFFALLTRHRAGSG